LTKPSQPAGAASQGPVEVTGYAEVREAWRNTKLSAAIHETGEHLFHEGTINRTEGREHMARRRALSRLIGRQGHKDFRDRILFPTIDAAMRDVLSHRDADGYARVELIRWSRRANFVLAASLAGYDGVDDPKVADEFFELWNTFTSGRPSSYRQSMGTSELDSPAFRATLAARQAIYERFYVPALERRQALVARHKAGELTEDELPHDLLTLIVLQVDPRWADPGLAERETLFVLNAGVRTTSGALYWSLRELFPWLEKHPEDRAKLGDDAFLLRVASEAMRLHPVAPGFPRIAEEDVHLSGGTEIHKGGMAVICGGLANVAPEIWGGQAAEFNPHRSVPEGMEPYGLAFGTGPHLCYGKPLVIGNEGIDGSLVYYLKTLMAARMEPDPAAPQPANYLKGLHCEVEDYFVRFPR
jgi:cytochrome P450